VRIHALVARRPLKLSTKPFCIGLPAAMWCYPELHLPGQDRIKVNSVPLSLTIMRGNPGLR
jgi:hypothetical protein